MPKVPLSFLHSIVEVSLADASYRPWPGRCTSTRWVRLVKTRLDLRTVWMKSRHSSLCQGSERPPFRCVVAMGTAWWKASQAVRQHWAWWQPVFCCTKAHLTSEYGAFKLLFFAYPSSCNAHCRRHVVSLIAAAGWVLLGSLHGKSDANATSGSVGQRWAARPYVRDPMGLPYYGRWAAKDPNALTGCHRACESHILIGRALILLIEWIWLDMLNMDSRVK
jgi:hypothetical protein